MSKYRSVLGPGKKCALLVSDMQRAYTEGMFDPEFNQDYQVCVINKLIYQAHQNQIPVIYTIIAFNEYEIAHPSLWMEKIPALKRLVVGSEAAELDPRLAYAPGRDLLITKKHTSSFFGTPLASQLKSQQIENLLITGCTTSGCVRATAIEGMEHGFKMIVIKDAVGDHWPEAHEQALLEIESRYGDVIDSIGALELIRKEQKK